MIFKIVKHNEVSEAQYTSYIAEWESTGELIVPYATMRKNLSFSQIQDKWAESETKRAYQQGFVPSTLYFMVDGQGRILGAIHFRHELNKNLLNNGGHIGYGIRPSERRKGYSKLMLTQMLKMIKAKGYDKVLITCDEDNVASAKTIEACNGIFSDRIESDGEWTRRYWIEL
ncbi:MAG: GNAT family N-acetyltransferase [Vallitaleaceae bacterium]|nr:GNAT family N-acetyltransferase [Vallitaleaceae bacterium]